MPYVEILIRLVLAIVLGGAIGLERSIAHKTAGMRTYALVALGSTLFVVISQVVSAAYPAPISFDPLRVASQIVVGVGFLGAGMITFSNAEAKVKGLTTAAGIWVAAAIGMAIGFGLYALAVLATLLTYVTFTFFWFIEKKIDRLAEKELL